MKNAKKIIFIFSFCTLLSIQVGILHAQSIPLKLSMVAATYGNDTVKSPSEVKLLVLLRDTLNISKVQVMLGSTEGGRDIFTKEFVFDDKRTFPDRTTYNRKGKVIFLSLGDISYPKHLFAEAWLVYPNRSSSVHVKTNRNK